MKVEEARAEALALLSHGHLTEIGRAIDAYGDARELQGQLWAIDEILSGGYTLEQIADMRRNVEEGVEGSKAIEQLGETG